MSIPGEPDEFERDVTNGGGVGSPPAIGTPNLRRDAGLQICRRRGDDHFTLNALGPLFDPALLWECEIPLTPDELFGHVEECRAAWQTGVVDCSEVVLAAGGGRRNARPFQDGWDLAARPGLLADIGPRLAVAGAKLFYFLFGPPPPCEPETVREAVAKALIEGSRERPLTVTITSDDFFVPWGLVYVHPDGPGYLNKDGSNFTWEGFWGFRHIVEHNPRVVRRLENGVRPNTQGKIPFGFNLDNELDAALNVRCIAPQRSFFTGHDALAVIERTQSAELQRDLSGPAFPDHITYFCCHGIGAGTPNAVNLRASRLRLTDAVPITACDVEFWLAGRGLPTRPAVFVNACQGGQMRTLFYQTVAAEFLRQGAMALLGAQVDLPAVFAAEFAQRFFARFLARSEQPVRAGPLLRELTREYVSQHNNPLGLVYSLYRGADCHVDWAPVRG